jgi:hypothetical protein
VIDIDGRLHVYAQLSAQRQSLLLSISIHIYDFTDYRTLFCLIKRCSLAFLCFLIHHCTGYPLKSIGPECEIIIFHHSATTRFTSGKISSCDLCFLLIGQWVISTRLLRFLCKLPPPSSVHLQLRSDSMTPSAVYTKNCDEIIGLNIDAFRVAWRLFWSIWPSTSFLAQILGNR